MIQKLLNPDHSLRLKAEGVKSHPFFKQTSWQTVRQQPAPFIPKPDHALDTSYFDGRNARFSAMNLSSFAQVPIPEEQIHIQSQQNGVQHDLSDKELSEEAPMVPSVSRDSSLELFGFESSLQGSLETIDSASLTGSQRSSEVLAPPLNRSRRGTLQSSDAFSTFSYTNYSVLGELATKSNGSSIKDTVR